MSEPNSDDDDHHTDDITPPATTSSDALILCSGLRQFIQMRSDSNETFSLASKLEKFIEKTKCAIQKQTPLQDMFVNNNLNTFIFLYFIFILEDYSDFVNSQPVNKKTLPFCPNRSPTAME